MADDRRFNDTEVEDILALAVRNESAAQFRGSEGRGLTLAELQTIGSEAGISPDEIARAAYAVEARGAALPRVRSLGMQVSAGQVVRLPRRPTDAEWDTLVSEFRSTFAATGVARDLGSTREWSNGALRVLLESTVDGHQLRFTTVNRRFRSLIRMGAVLAVWGLVLLTILAPEISDATGGLAEILTKLLPSLLVTGAGVGALGLSGVSLPKWVDTRETQFQHLAERARGLLAGSPADHPDP